MLEIYSTKQQQFRLFQKYCNKKCSYTKYFPFYFIFSILHKKKDRKVGTLTNLEKGKKEYIANYYITKIFSKSIISEAFGF